MKVDIHEDQPRWPLPGPEIKDGRLVWRDEIVTEEDKNRVCLGCTREIYAYAQINKVKPCLLLDGVSLTDENAWNTLLNDIELKKNPECILHCHKHEEFGMSYRQAKNKEWSNPWHGNSHTEVILSNECNSSCIYCDPMFSSNWEKEIETSKSPLPKVLELKRLPIKTVNNEKIISIRKAGPNQLEKVLEIVRNLGMDSSKAACIAITGGEPMLNMIEDDHLGLVLETFYKANSLWGRRIRYDLNTSLNVSEQRLREIISYLKAHTELYPCLDLVILPSIDSLYDNFNYVRYGNNFHRFERNFDILLSETDFTIEAQSGLHPVAIPQLLEFFTYMNNKAKNIRPFMITPAYIEEHLRFLNNEFNHYLEDALTYLRTNEIFLEKIEVNISMISKLISRLENSNPNPKIIAKAIELFEWFKLERGTDLADVSPEFHQYLIRMANRQT